MFEGFEPRFVRGLYNFAHYQREDGSWIQVRYGTSGPRISGAVLRASDGKMWSYSSRAELIGIMLEHLGV